MKSKQKEASMQWIRGARRLVHPRRNSPMYFPQDEALLGSMSRQEFRQKFQSARLNFCSWLQEKGILTESMQEQHFQWAKEMEEDWQEVSNSPLQVMHEALACYWWVQHWHREDEHDILLQSLLATEGISFVLEVLVQAQKLSATLYPKEEDRFTFAHEKINSQISLLRKALTFASDEAYQEALAQAENLWENLDILYWKAVFAYLFPEKKDWAVAAAQEFLEEETPQVFTFNYLVASGLPFKSLQLVIQKIKPLIGSTIFLSTENATYLASAVEQHGSVLWSEMVGIIQQIHSPSKSHTAIFMLLAVFKHPEVATYFASQLNEVYDDLFVCQNYLERHPDIGIPALEKVIEESPAEETYFAQDLLEELIDSL